MSHLLLSIVGNTPQVVTETLYAIHAQGRPWPTEIQIITTTVGKKGALRLINEGILTALCNDLGVPSPSFSEKDILLVPDAHGNPVADARTVADHEALANFIVTQVRNLTDDTITENIGRSIHASIAGGRKTMTFYLGYAISLFGRAGDCLSHVLVSAEFENLPNFFYPRQNNQPLLTTKGKQLDSSQAVVELADIPFFRHRNSLPALLKTSAGNGVNFRELIGWINLGENPSAIKLRLDTKQRLIEVSDEKGALRKIFEPGILEFAFYRLLATATRASETDIMRPQSNRADRSLSKLFCDELILIHRLPSAETLQQCIEIIENWNAISGALKDTTLLSLSSGIKGSWFDQRIHTLKAMFSNTIPHSVTNQLLPRIIWSEEGERLEETRSVKSGGYGIPLNKESIFIF